MEKIGHHADFVEQLPTELLDYINKNPDIHIDLEVEAKNERASNF